MGARVVAIAAGYLSLCKWHWWPRRSVARSQLKLLPETMDAVPGSFGDEK
ncbi:MAG: hypothetical protein JWR24_740 [Actinoallomurus sp.]|nr:hypothetical protein [Actinoallomurus sp.]